MCSTRNEKSEHWLKPETVWLHLNMTVHGWRKAFRSARLACLWRKKSSFQNLITYLYDEKLSRWCLSPAYDLTYSNSIGGEHATCVNGNGYNPGRTDLLAVAAQAGIEPKEARYILQEVEEKVAASLQHISTD